MLQKLLMPLHSQYNSHVTKLINCVYGLSLLDINTKACVKLKTHAQECTSLTLFSQNRSGVTMFTYSIYEC